MAWVNVMVAQIVWAGRAEGKPRGAALWAACDAATRRHHRPYTTSRYPTAVSVSRCRGCAGSASSFWRRWPM